MNSNIKGGYIVIKYELKNIIVYENHIIIDNNKIPLVKNITDNFLPISGYIYSSYRSAKFLKSSIKCCEHRYFSIRKFNSQIVAIEENLYIIDLKNEIDFISAISLEEGYKKAKQKYPKLSIENFNNSHEYDSHIQNHIINKPTYNL